MANAPTARIHPSAVVSPEAEIGDGVEVGPYVVIEGHVTIGPGTVIRPHVLLCGPLTLGTNNQVFSGAVLGERPQHLKYNGEATGLEIGDHNIIREQVVIHRGTTHSWTTRIGSHNFFMANSHVGHDCQVGDRCIFANGALVAGHCVLGDNVYLSGNSAVHQFVHIGRLAMLSGCSATSKDVPPFSVLQGINNTLGVNVVGMRRAGIPRDQIDAVREAFRILLCQSMVIPAALAKIETHLGHVDAVKEVIGFIRGSQRGINYMRDRSEIAA